MANEKVTYSKGLSTNLPEDHIAGRLLFETDTGNVYLDTTDESRIQITDTRKLNTDGSTAVTGNLDMGSHNIKNVAEPTDNQDASTKHYVDTAFTELESELANTVAGYLPLKGGTMTGQINMGSNKITTSYNAIDNTDVVNKQYVDNQDAMNLKISGVTPMAGNLNMANHSITNLTSPTSNLDAVNKQYVDSAIGNITSFSIDSNGGTGYASLEALKQAHPTGDIGVFYLVVNNSSTEPNVFDEYFWTGTSYERAGSFGDVDTSNLATKDELQDYLPLTGGTLTGPLNLDTNKITSSANAVDPIDIPNKQYVDSIVSSSVGNSTYTFTASFDGTTLTATAVGNTPSSITWKSGDMISITLENKSSDTPFYFGNYNFSFAGQTILISTMPTAKGTDIRYMQKTLLNAIYVVVESQATFLVTSSDYDLQVNSATSGLDIVESNNNTITAITHKKLAQSEYQGPTSTGSTTTLNYGDSFVVPAVGYDVNGHIVAGGSQTFQLPQATATTDTKVTQNNTTANQDFRILLSNDANDTTETAEANKSGQLLFNPSTGTLVAPKFIGIIDDGVVT